ncbi:hypothetical protein JCM8547_004452 [Rhodosporidiobolus lusitaniae]
MSGSVQDLLDNTVQQAQRAWDAVVPSNLDNLSSLPSHLADSVNSLVDKLTNHGTLGGDPRSWLPEQLSPAPPPPPPSPTSSRNPLVEAFLRNARDHPVAYSLAALGLTSGTTYYLFPRQAAALAAPLTRLVPLALLPEPKHRPLRLLPGTHGVAGEVRKEAIVVLGADGPVGRELALEMERRGFVVIATVRNPNEVDVLERMSRGWLKALVLDPNESSSVGPFLRSLSTALSLRFPLHTSGDPYSRPAHALALTGVLNCLSLSSELEALAPLEAAENDVVRKLVGERIATIVGIAKGVLPILRTAAGRPGAPTGAFVNLVPSASSNLSLPFLALTSAADAALSSLFHSLRRESSASSTSSLVSLVILETGLFSLPSSPSPAPLAQVLPIRLESVYAPALARRVPPVGAEEVGGRKKCRTRNGTEVRKLAKKVFKILVRPGNAKAVERIGAGSKTYLLVSYLPHALIDLCLTLQDRLYGAYLAHLSARISSLSSRLTSSSSSRAARPLPTPPSAAAQHPDFLRPASQQAPTQVPTQDPFIPHPQPSPPASSAASTTSFYPHSEEEQDETGSQSSLEDFGLAGSRTSAAGMDGSFVQVERE